MLFGLADGEACAIADGEGDAAELAAGEPLLSGLGDGEASGDYFMMNYILGPNQGVVGAIRPHYGPANSPVSMASVASPS